METVRRRGSLLAFSISAYVSNEGIAVLYRSEIVVYPSTKEIIHTGVTSQESEVRRTTRSRVELFNQTFFPSDFNATGVEYALFFLYPLQWLWCPDLVIYIQQLYICNTDMYSYII